jgi:hypothetical protein
MPVSGQCKKTIVNKDSGGESRSDRRKQSATGCTLYWYCIVRTENERVEDWKGEERIQ